MRQRTYEVNGGRRTVDEIEASHVGPDLNRVAVTLTRLPRRSRDQVAGVPSDPRQLEPAVPSTPVDPGRSEAAA